MFNKEIFYYYSRSHMFSKKMNEMSKRLLWRRGFGGVARLRNVLVVNAGSSSLKMEIVNDSDEIREWSDDDDDVKNVKNVDCVVHRVVHGGEIYNEASIVNETMLNELEELRALAPLHNPVAVEMIQKYMKIFPDVPHVACFDTAFHTKTMSEVQYRYAIPSNRDETKRIRKYGFHGLNHQYTSREAARQLDLLNKPSAIVVAHLGNGASVCAVRDGRSVNTSMVRPLLRVSLSLTHTQNNVMYMCRVSHLWKD